MQPAAHEAVPRRWPGRVRAVRASSPAARPAPGCAPTLLTDPLVHAARGPTAHALVVRAERLAATPCLAAAARIPTARLDSWLENCSPHDCGCACTQKATRTGWKSQPHSAVLCQSLPNL
jgi:hypothetical protein